jgi:alpha-L-fucosidase
LSESRKDGEYEARERRTDWFKRSRFGMFIPWGLYAIPARGAAQQSVERMSREAYNTYFEEFDPSRYEPRVWAKAVKAAGQRYGSSPPGTTKASASLTAG